MTPIFKKKTILLERKRNSEYDVNP